MNAKSTLEELESFYGNLEKALERYRFCIKDPNVKPIAVGSDAAYIVIKRELGHSSLMELIEGYDVDLEKILPKTYKKDPLQSRFGSVNRPMFGDADIYLPTPHNVDYLCEALSSMGYKTNRKDLDSKGCLVFSNKESHPVKVDVSVKTNRNHFRPNSDKPVDSLLPSIKECSEVRNLEEFNRILFIEPKCLRERLMRDIKYNLEKGEDIPLKMFEDLIVMSRYHRIHMYKKDLDEVYRFFNVKSF